MERNSPLERRYSFNTFPIQPIAESTCVSWNSNNTQACSKFRWGVPIMNSRSQRSKNLNSAITLSEQKGKCCRSHSKEHTKIDPRIYADAQSRGLSSRIVKYHGSGTRLNRSISAFNISSKPGQFPTVHLKQTPLPMRAIKHTLSVTHIPPPEISNFQGNTLSSLLRSNSVLGIHKTDEDLLHENRPIIHPPPTKYDLAPTRSVLDVLKEISRKRINNEDLNITETTSNFKRQRDVNVTSCISATPLTTTVTSTIAPAETICAQNNENLSPEQPKKRICKYTNNDITSSLSSSVKRKLNDNLQIGQTKQLLTSFRDNNSNSITTQRAKMLKKTSPSNDKEILYKNTSPQLSIHLLPSSKDMNDMRHFSFQKKILNNSAVRTSFTEPIIDGKCNVSNDNNNVNCNSRVPRLTLFNKTYETTSTTLDSNHSDDSFENNESNNRIQFVKPKKSASLPNRNNPLLEKNQKSKLAVMLRSLKFDLCGEDSEDEDTKDELDSSRQKKKLDSVVNSTLDVIQSQSVIESTCPSSTSITNTLAIASPSNTNVVTTTKNLPNINTTANKLSPLVGLKLSKPNAQAQNGFVLDVISNPAPSSISSQTASVTITTSSTNEPKFSFGLVKEISKSTTTTTTAAVVTTCASLTSPNSTTTTESLTSIHTAAILNSNSVTTTTPTNMNFTFGVTTQTEKPAAVPLELSKNLITFDSFVAPATTVITTTVNTPTTATNHISSSVASPFTFTCTPSINESSQIVSSMATATAVINASSNNLSLTSSAPTTMSGMTFTQLAQSSSFLPKTVTTTSVSSTSTGGFSFNSAIQTNNNKIDPIATATIPFSFSSALGKSNDTFEPFSFGTLATSTATTITSFDTTGKNAFNFGNNAIACTKTKATTTTTAKITPIMQAPSTFNTFAGMVKKSSTSILDSAVQPTFNTLSGLSAKTANSNEKTNAPKNIFGSNISNSQKNKTQATAASTLTASNFIFGSITSIPTSTPGTGGATASTQDTKKGFSFGSSTANNTITFGDLSEQSTTGSGLGASSKPAFSNIFASKSDCGITVHQNKPFTFGSNLTTNNITSNNSNSNGSVNINANASSNLFKDATKSLNANQSIGAGDGGGTGFGFSSIPFIKPMTDATSMPASKNFSFNVNENNSNSNNAATPARFNSTPLFNFGMTSMAKTSNGIGNDAGKGDTSTVNKPFTFGSVASTPKLSTLNATTTANNGIQTANLFGTARALTSVPSATFTFVNNTSNSNSTVGTVSTPNVFAAPNPSNSPKAGDRPIKRATRRLQK